MLDRNKKPEHDFEASFLLGRFMTEHLSRVYKAFDGDITAAIVLGTIGQYNYHRYYAEIGAKSPDGFQHLVARGEHLAYQRHCNAMSISESTGIPRETVRRKIRVLIKKGWLKQLGPDKLVVTEDAQEALRGIRPGFPRTISRDGRVDPCAGQETRSVSCRGQARSLSLGLTLDGPLIVQNAYANPAKPDTCVDLAVVGLSFASPMRRPAPTRPNADHFGVRA